MDPNFVKCTDVTKKYYSFQIIENYIKDMLRHFQYASASSIPLIVTVGQIFFPYKNLLPRR